MDRSLHKWLSVAFFNLMLVAFLGCLLRYKIAYSLPFLNQKFVLNAHSHFAFSGWVTQALMALMVKFLSDKTHTDAFRKFNWILWLNVLSAYGMLLTFPFQGYATGSIIFSTASVFAGYAFAFTYWKELNKIPASVDILFLKSALFFNVLSSAGTFSLATLMISGSTFQNLYVASIYFFLHFQYNGWFLFTCMGLLCSSLIKYGIPPQKLKPAFYLFVSACIPAYLLSALWIPMPMWVYVLVALAGIAQLVGWGIILQAIRKNLGILKANINRFTQILFFFCAIAYTLKLMLQAASAIPSLSYLSYGFRPIVIGYLHLVLLGVVSLFITSYCINHKYLILNKTTKNGVIIFVAGIIINEVFLMLQGIGDLVYISIPYIDEELLAAALILFIGLLLINVKNKLKKADQ